MKKLWMVAAVLAVSANANADDKKPAAAAGAKPTAAATEKTTAATPEKTEKAPPAEAQMAPPKPGPETEALKPFSKSATWTGKVPAGAFGANPEMPSKGKATCKWILNNLWVHCDLEDTVGAGKMAMNWKGSWDYGWDFSAKEYRGVMVDTMGAAGLMKGKIEGTKLIWESASEHLMMGQPTKMRTTMDAADPKAIKFTGEHLVGKDKWVLDEEAVLKTK